MKITETEHLELRQLYIDDAPFILKLTNDPGWLRFIGDKGIKTIEDARGYILEGPVKSYRQFGFGLFLTILKQANIPMGICGLLKRDYLDHADLGFAFLPEFRGKGFAAEASAAVVNWGKERLGLRRILAITRPDNHRSVKLLKKSGFTFVKPMTSPVDHTDIHLFRLDL